MPLSDKLPSGIRRLFRLPATRSRRMRDLDEEIAFHIETHMAALRARGLSDDDARAAAIARFGDAGDLRAYCGHIAARREPWRRLRQWADELRADTRIALRQIARAPAVTAAATLILALGIGVNTGVFNIVYNTLLAPLPFADGNRMVMFFSTSGGGRILITPDRELLEAWRARARSVEQIIVLRDAQFVLGDSTRGSTKTLEGAAIPPEAMAFIGVQPMFGRGILPSDTAAGAPPVALLGESIWRRDFGASRDVLGQAVLLDGVQHTVIGVAPAAFFLPFTDAADVFVALRRGATGRPTGFAKLRPGVSIDDANREMRALFPPRSALNAYDDPPRVSRAIDMVGRQRKQMILVFFGAVGLVLLIACANVGNLLLARAWTRRREFAIRSALGAGSWRIARQILTETLILAALAGALGIGVAFLVTHGMRATLPEWATELGGMRVEGAVLVWSAGISAIAGLLFGAAPALFAARAGSDEPLNGSGRTSAGTTGARRVRAGLIVVEVALSVVLLAGAGLLARTIVAIGRAEVGFDPRGLASAFLRADRRAPADARANEASFAGVLENVRAIPGVRGATFAMQAPPDFAIAMGGLRVEGRETAPSDSLRTLGVNAVPPDFFAFAGIPILRGRTFSSSGSTGDGEDGGEVIISEALARRLGPGGSALGARVRLGREQWRTVVGIVGDVRTPADETNRRLNLDLQIYTPFRAQAMGVSILVRSELSVGVLTPAMRAAVRAATPAMKLSEITSAEVEIERQSAPQRFVLTLIGSFAVLAVLLAAVGLHAVMSYAVNQRTREIGVRAALGARAADVARLVLGQGLALAAAGIAIGIAGALVATRALGAFLYGVGPGDPLTLGAVAAAALVIAAVATWGPARRASRIDPVDALRAE